MYSQANQSQSCAFVLYVFVCWLGFFFQYKNPTWHSLFKGTVKYNIPDETDAPSFNLYHNIKQDQNSFSCKHTMKVCGRYVE